MRLDFNDSELKSLVSKLRTFDSRLEKAGMRKVVNAGATPLVKHTRRILPKGRGLRLSGEKRKHLRQTLIKKVKRYGSSYVAVFGHQYPMLGHSFWLYEGVKPHAITAGIKGKDARRTGSGKSTGKKVLSDGKKFYGRQVQHPGFSGKNYLEMGINRGRFESINAMADKAKDVIAKAARSK